MLPKHLLVLLGLKIQDLDKGQPKEHPFDPFWCTSLLDEDLEFAPFVKRGFLVIVSCQKQMGQVLVFQNLRLKGENQLPNNHVKF